jgi:hypothetical protein
MGIDVTEHLLEIVDARPPASTLNVRSASWRAAKPEAAKLQDVIEEREPQH